MSESRKPCRACGSTQPRKQRTAYCDACPRGLKLRKPSPAQDFESMGLAALIESQARDMKHRWTTRHDTQAFYGPGQRILHTISYDALLVDRGTDDSEYIAYGPPVTAERFGGPAVAIELDGMCSASP